MVLHYGKDSTEVDDKSGTGGLPGADEAGHHVGLLGPGNPH